MSETQSARPVGTLQTLDRGVRALELIAVRPEGLSVAQLATALDVHRAVCYRIVSTLEAHGLVTRGESGRIRLGAGLAILAGGYEPALLRHAEPALASLADEASATSFLSVAQGEECVVVMVAEPEAGVLRVGYRVGTRHPLTRGAAGLAILSGRAASAGDAPAVVEARGQGYCVTVGELERGAVGVAAPVGRGGSVGVDAAVGVVAIDGLDIAVASDAVCSAAARLRLLASA